MSEPVRIAVREEYDVPSARLLVAEAAKRGGLGDLQRHYLLTAVTELATNLCFHTSGGGQMQVRVIENPGGRRGVEVIAEDDGPGIPDLEAAMRDGFTTGGGLGYGLPAVRRLVDEFDLASEVGHGTRVTARIWAR